MSLQNLTSGHFLTDEAVVLATANSTLTVSQTARFLKMSEERLNELLNDHVIDYRLDNGQRMVNRESIMRFERETRAMEEGCVALTRMSQAMGTYDD